MGSLSMISKIANWLQEQMVEIARLCATLDEIADRGALFLTAKQHERLRFANFLLVTATKEIQSVYEELQGEQK